MSNLFLIKPPTKHENSINKSVKDEFKTNKAENDVDVTKIEVIVMIFQLRATKLLKRY